MFIFDSTAGGQKTLSLALSSFLEEFKAHPFGTRDSNTAPDKNKRRLWESLRAGTIKSKLDSIAWRRVYSRRTLRRTSALAGIVTPSRHLSQDERATD